MNRANDVSTQSNKHANARRQGTTTTHRQRRVDLFQVERVVVLRVGLGLVLLLPALLALGLVIVVLVGSGVHTLA